MIRFKNSNISPSILRTTDSAGREKIVRVAAPFGIRFSSVLLLLLGAAVDPSRDYCRHRVYVVVTIRYPVATDTLTHVLRRQYSIVRRRRSVEVFDSALFALRLQVLVVSQWPRER